MSGKIKAKTIGKEEEAWKIQQKNEMTAFIKNVLMKEIVENSCKFGESIKMSRAM